jgi:hypothetical protein
LKRLHHYQGEEIKWVSDWGHRAAIGTRFSAFFLQHAAGKVVWKKKVIGIKYSVAGMENVCQSKVSYSSKMLAQYYVCLSTYLTFWHTISKKTFNGGLNSYIISVNMPWLLE